jgi:hypothetical protein
MQNLKGAVSKDNSALSKHDGHKVDDKTNMTGAVSAHSKLKVARILPLSLLVLFPSSR